MLHLTDSIAGADQAAMDACKARWDSIAKPLGGLGALEDTVIRIAGLTSNPAYSIGKRAVVVFCADNGVVANNGVTQSGMDVTGIVAANLTTGKTSVCVMAKSIHTDVVPVDMGIYQELDIPNLLKRRIAPGTQDISKGPAMSRAQAEQAIQTGIDTVRDLAQMGYKILIGGEMGIGNTTTSSAVASVLLRRDPAQMTGRGAGLSDAGLTRKIDIIRKALAVNAPDPDDPVDTIAKVGGFDIAALTGMYLGGAIYRIPIVLDGFISNVAALAACHISPHVRCALIAGHISTEPACKLLLDKLELTPLVTAGMHLGEGTGAVAALALIDMAYTVYNEMSTFEDVSIEQYTPQ